jgi:glycosyltransferase involved in cell wall biosynthesis
MLESEEGTDKFEVILTADKNANKYCRWIDRKWGHIKSLHFAGFMDRKKLDEYYAQSDCLVFPSQVETWGLPISEFAIYERPMLLADLPYAHETAAGSSLVAFFDPNNPKELKEKMKHVMTNNFTDLHPVVSSNLQPPVVHTWQEIIER